MNHSDTNTTRKRGWTSCLLDPGKFENLLKSRGRPMRWLWVGGGSGKIDAKTGRRIEQNKPISTRTIFKIAHRLECDPTELVSDSNAKMILETARGRVSINDLERLWGGDPSGGYTVDQFRKIEYRTGEPGFQSTTEETYDYSGFSPHDFISIDRFDSQKFLEVAALDLVSSTTIATKPNVYELVSTVVRNARVPDGLQEAQRISLDIEPMVLVHDVDVSSEVSKRLMALLAPTEHDESPLILPTVSEFEEFEKIRSENLDHLNWFASRSIQILDAGLRTDFVAILDDGQQVFASFSKPLLVLAPTSLIDVEVTYPRYRLDHGMVGR